jgi:ligand-binding sensor domain-containing protein/serine phosphatase RsbU (regulator of sigma subunit)
MCINKSKITFLIIIFSLPILISAQAEKKFYFENISIPDGLSNTNVWDIVQDKFGFLWVATEDGLNRYDGYKFKIYKNDPEDNSTIPNNVIHSILIDNEENLWIATESGLCKYDRVSESFRTFLLDSVNTSAPANKLFKIYEDSKNRFWVGSAKGLYKFDRTSNKFEITNVRNEDKKAPSSGVVFSILETSSGDIYSGYLFSGLVKLNENENIFEIVDVDEPNRSVLNNRLIVSLFEDKSGLIWICNEIGLYTFDPHNNEFYKIDLFETTELTNNTSTVAFIYQDDEGYLWISTIRQGMYRYNLRTKSISKLEQDDFPIGVGANDPFFKFFRDDFGVLWVGTFAKGVLKLDFQKEPFRLYPKPGGNNNRNNNLVILSILKSSKDDKIVWLGTNEGFFKYNMEDKSSKKFENEKGNSKSLPANVVRSIVQLNDIGLWLGTNNGLSYFNISNNTFTNYDLYETTYDDTIYYNVVNNISSDDYGNLWLATNNGLVKFDAKTQKKSFIREISKKTYDENLLSYIDSLHTEKQYISSILEVGDYQDLKKDFNLNENTNVLVVSVGEGLEGMWDYGWLKNIKNDTLFIHKNGTELYNYFSGNGKNRIAVDVLKLSAGEYQLGYVSDDSHSYGKWNTEAPKDSSWWGIQVFEISDDDYTLFYANLKNDQNKPVIQGTTSNVVKYSKEGNLLIGSNAGISKYNISKNSVDNFIYSNSIPSNNNTKNVRDIFIDNDATLWVATQGGLINYNQDTKVYKLLIDKDGLPSNYVVAIEEDKYENLWLSTRNGITKFNKDLQNPIFINFDVKDGLQSYTFARRASYKSGNGELYFAGINGFNTFHSGNINKQEPKINISEMRINNKLVLPSTENSPLTKSVLDTKDIVLSYSQKNISFDFNSVHFSRPDKNKNAYMLEGFDKEGWIYTDRKFATYTNLPEGQYVFKVKGSNGDGIWNETGTSINIKVLPPWWRTIWAYIGYGFVFVGIVLGIDHLQRRRLLKRARETARIREAEIRAQLAEAESERKSKELEEARSLQLSMLPKELPQLPHLDIAVYMKTATEVGGDYYDFHIGIDGVLTVVVGDATGHGLNAGTMVTSTKSLFNALAPNPNIIETFHEMTRCLKLMRLEKLSMCMAMMKITGNNLIMSSAGMPPILLFRNETQAVEEHVMKGMPLGTFSDFPYSLRETVLESGDTILFMSDGFPELFNDKKEMYGYKRAKRLFEELGAGEPEEIISNLKTAGSEWVNDKDPDDDVTFVVIKVK